jgi:hypothetical protein
MHTALMFIVTAVGESNLTTKTTTILASMDKGSKPFNWDN